MTLLDEHRAVSMLVEKAGVAVTDVTDVVVFGNHSATQFPDFTHAKIQGKPASEVVDLEWLQTTFIESVQQRGAAVIEARGASSAASAANAAVDSVASLVGARNPGQLFSVVVSSQGYYESPEGLMVSCPCRYIDGQVVVVTGGGTGIGLAAASNFLSGGARLALLGRRVRVVEDAARELDPSQERVGAWACDIRDADQVSDVIEAIVERFGRIDVLINNAGIFRANRLLTTDMDEFNLVMDINCNGVFLGMRTVAGPMIESGGGSIVNISSIRGIVSRANAAAAYSTSKGAIRIFSKVTAVLHAKDHIRCNSVHPGVVDTPANKESTALDPAYHAQLISTIPLGRGGQPEDIAYGVIYLASDESAWVTGTELIIDGGTTAI